MKAKSFKYVNFEMSIKHEDGNVQEINETHGYV